jgi:glyoxylase-like metal-dependent hydrolase (beta-lactamase superfamily II)
VVDPAGRAVFANAELIVHEREAAFWLDRVERPDDSERIQRNTKAQRTVTAPYRDRMRRVADGEIMPGVTARLAPGHTPGHTNWLVRSGADRLLIWGDVVHLASVQMARPDATLVFDVDPQTARATRERVLGFAASEQLVVAGAHLPFPGFGRVTPAGTGFSYRPDP